MHQQYYRPWLAPSAPQGLPCEGVGSSKPISNALSCRCRSGTLCTEGLGCAQSAKCMSWGLTWFCKAACAVHTHTHSDAAASGFASGSGAGSQVKCMLCRRLVYWNIGMENGIVNDNVTGSACLRNSYLATCAACHARLCT